MEGREWARWDGWCDQRRLLSWWNRRMCHMWPWRCHPGIWFFENEGWRVQNERCDYDNWLMSCGGSGEELIIIMNILIGKVFIVLIIIIFILIVVVIVFLNLDLLIISRRLRFRLNRRLEALKNEALRSGQIKDSRLTVVVGKIVVGFAVTTTFAGVVGFLSFFSDLVVVVAAGKGGAPEKNRMQSFFIRVKAFWGSRRRNMTVGTN